MVLCLKLLLGRKMHCHKAKSRRVVVKRRFVGFARNLFISQDVNATRTDPSSSICVEVEFGSALSVAFVILCDVIVAYIRPRFCFRLEERGHCAVLCM